MPKDAIPNDFFNVAMVPDLNLVQCCKVFWEKNMVHNK